MPSIRWGHVLFSSLRLLVALIALVAALASGTTVAEAQNGVAAINFETSAAVEAAGDISPGHVGSDTVLFDDGTSGCSSAPNNGLLSGEGLVGTYDDLIAAGAKGDNITPHHIPSANHMSARGVDSGDALAINMEHPFPGAGGRHRATFTDGTQADAAMSSRDALAAGVRDARAIYQRQGLYGPDIRQRLQDLMAQNKAAFPELFG